MKTSDQRAIMQAFNDHIFGMLLDFQMNEQNWNNCGFSYEVCVCAT